MGNRTHRRFRGLDCPSPERDTDATEVDTPNRDNVTLTNANIECQESLGENILGFQLTEPGQVSKNLSLATNPGPKEYREKRENEIGNGR